MLKAFVIAALLSLGLAGAAAAQNCPAYPYTLTNGATADATQVMADLNTVLNCANSHMNAPVFSGSASFNGNSFNPGANTLAAITVGFPSGSSFGGGILMRDGVYDAGMWTDYNGASLELAAGGTANGFSYPTLGVFSNGGISVGGGYSYTTAPANGAIIEGNVGIGNSAPVAKLQTTGISWINAGSGNTYYRAQGLTVDSAVSGTYSNGTDPGDELRTFSVVTSATATAPTILSLRNISAGPFWDVVLDSNDSAKLKFSQAGSQPTLTMSGGDVGIGTTTPLYTLQVAGTVFAYGGAGALSDVRDKDQIASIPSGAISLVQKLRPVTFVWRKPKDDGMQGQQIGFIAQEVEKVLPSAVLERDHLRMEHIRSWRGIFRILRV